MSVSQWREPEVTEEFRCLVAEPLSVEARFGLRRCQPRGEDSHCDVQLGPWSSDVDGNLQLGALAIAADHILGEVPFIRRPPESWSLTTELTIDFVAPVEPDSELHIWAAPTRIESTGGFAHGGMVNDRNQVVALCSTRTLLVPSVPMAPAAVRLGSVITAKGSSATTLDDHLGLECLDSPDHGVRIRMNDPAVWQNDFGILHGGVWTCLAEMAASRLVSRTRPELTTASVHTTYLRPGGSGLPVTVDARIQHLGSRLGLVECTGRSEDGTVCTISTVTARRAGDLTESEPSR